MPHTTFYLSQQIVFASPLLATHFVLYDFAEILCSLIKLFCMKIVVTKGIIPFLLRSPIDTVALHIANHIFSIIKEIILYKTFCQPSSRLTINGWLAFVESRHIGKGSSSFFKFALIELGATHQHPSTPNEGVVFFSRKPLYIFLSLTTILIPFWLRLYTMKMNCLLRLSNSNIIIRLSQISRSLIANSI